MPTVILHALIFASLAALCIRADAATREDCRSEVTRTLESLTTKKLPPLQVKEIERVGNNICYNTAIYEIQKELIEKLAELREQLRSLNASYCGSNPDVLGRGATCRKAKDEDDAQDAELLKHTEELKKGEGKIRKLEQRYTNLRAKPLPNNAAELKPAGRKVAAVAKVKADILNSLKDPDSATFRQITASPDGGVICGEVNAKNSMGGYVGYKKFINIGLEWDDFTFYEEAGNSVLIDACKKQEARD